MSITDDVRAFAELCARYDDPFADRAALLAAAGVSAVEWGRVREAWLDRFAASGERGAALARAFGEAYAAQREGRPAASKGAPPGAETEDISHIVRQVLPFVPGAAPAADDALVSTAPLHVAASLPGTTGDLDIAALARRILPFEPERGRAAPAGAACAPATGAPRRFVRFDPQTGEPLANPYWEDLPPAPKKA